jgi:hypothetical protein
LASNVAGARQRAQAEGESELETELGKLTGIKPGKHFLGYSRDGHEFWALSN